MEEGRKKEKKKKKEENSTELQKPNAEAEVYNNNKKCDLIYRYTWKESESAGHAVVSNSLRPHGLYSPWDSPGQNTGVSSLSFLQGIFLNPGIKPRSPAL